jgi:hypothetical protein
MSDDEFGTGVFAGLIVALVVTLGIVFCYWVGGGNRHDMNWNDTVCVKTADRIVGDVVVASTTHCITAPELAKWAQEHNR